MRVITQCTKYDPTPCERSFASAQDDTQLRSRYARAKVRAHLDQLSTINLLRMAAANDLRKGQAIKYNGNTAIVLEVHHRTPGNLRAFVQAIIRYINTGKSADVRFGSTDKVELVDID